jgi:hypothetical protein
VVLMLKREGASTCSSRGAQRVVRLDGSEPLLDDGQARLDGVERQARLEPRHDVERVVLRVVEIQDLPAVAEGRVDLHVQPERQPDFRRDQPADSRETRRRDADDRVRTAVEPQRRADEIGRAAQALPQAVARDDDGNVGVGPSFLRREEAAADRPDAHEVEEVVGDEEDEGPAHRLWPRASPASEKLTAVTSLNASFAPASVRNSV